MYKGIYIALSGAVQKQRYMDIFAQNVANAATAGYKKERISFKDYLIPVDNKPPFITDGRTMTETSRVVTDFSKGTLMRTDNPLDIAINGEGFFALEGNRYTRNGNFRIDNEGYLATQDDVKVLGSGGPIAVQGKKIDVGASGEVFVDDISVGKLKVVDFSDRNTLKKLSGGVFRADVPGEELQANISQGYLEASNVEAIKEMVQMITSLREFEAYQKMIQAFDEAASKVTNEMGR
ncbi:MAG: flagellar basal-body rod protein FlgF [Nitrospiraceae bacterium]|nr:MAG: flagellar basal-body rod protein FlgF [Nitrospiraceae bacterium]